MLQLVIHKEFEWDLTLVNVQVDILDWHVRYLLR